MAEFTVSSEGLLSETGVHQAAQQVCDVWPFLDGLAIEANMMLVRAYRSVGNVGEPLLARFGLSAPRVSVVAMLSRADKKRLTIGEIAAAREVSSPNVSKLIDALEVGGWVRRVGNPRDGRSSLIELTDKGVQWAEAILPSTYEPVTDLWSSLTKEEKRLVIHLLAKVRLRAATKAISIEDVVLADHALVSSD